MKKDIFRYVESELYDYEATLDFIKQSEDDIIQDGALTYDKDKISKTYKITSSTEDKAIKLCTNKQLKKARETIAAIDKAKQRLDSEELNLLDLKYNKGIHYQKIISNHISMSERSYRRKRTKIVYLVANEMGFMVNL